MRQLAEEQLAEQKQKQREKDIFIDVRNETVERVFGHLEALSNNLAEVKEKMLSDFDTLLAMKAELDVALMTNSRATTGPVQTAT